MIKKQLLSLILFINIIYGDTNKSSKDTDPAIDINSTTLNKTLNNTEQNQSTISPKQIHIKPQNGFVETDNNLNIIKLDNNKNRVNNLGTTHLFKISTESYRSTYLVKQGDTIGAIARRFNVAQSEILIINPQINRTKLKIGKEIFMPLDQAVIDETLKRENRAIEENELNEKAEKTKNYNQDIINDKLTNRHNFILPLTSNINKLKSNIILKKDQKDSLIIESTAKQLRVTASAYTSHIEQTSSTPFIGAWGYRLIPGERTIAISRDLEIEYGLTNGKKVKIGGLDGEYVIRDKMNKRYEKHIDIYMGLDKQKAIRWGRRSVIIYW